MSLGVRAVSPSSSVQCVGCHEQRPFTKTSSAHPLFFFFFPLFFFPPVWRNGGDYGCWCPGDRSQGDAKVCEAGRPRSRDDRSVCSAILNPRAVSPKTNLALLTFSHVIYFIYIPPSAFHFFRHLHCSVLTLLGGLQGPQGRSERAQHVLERKRAGRVTGGAARRAVRGESNPRRMERPLATNFLRECLV